MPNQKQYDVTLQPIRDIDCKIAILDKYYNLLDEISGLTTDVDFNIDADSDIRRTANINMVLKNDSSTNPRTSFYWTAGNEYWFDKIIQIYTAILDIKTNEYVWVKEGTYCINSPSISYDATTNQLSFQAVDLMANLTGMRNGQLEGLEYVVEAGRSIKGAIEGILIQQGVYSYILYDPPQSTTPEEIRIDIGGTAYDLLHQLRDINANWEMFFDVDGVFHFQQIPSGKVILDPYTGETGEPTPLVDNYMWNKLMTSYSYDTSFEDIKNYVEVLGKMHEPSEFGTATINSNVLTLVTTKSINDYLNNDWKIGFTIATSTVDTNPTRLATPITFIVVKDVNNASIGSIDISQEPIIVGNQDYVIYIEVGATTSNISLEFLGKIQSHAIAIENNPDSPFYVGDANSYTCATMHDVDFVPTNENYITDVISQVSGNTTSVNLSPWITSNDFSSAPLNTQWSFRVWVPLQNETSVTRATIIFGGQIQTFLLNNSSGDSISLDFSAYYLLSLTKTGASSYTILFKYFPLSAHNFSMSTTAIITMPVFDNQVRLICAGDEYDNIYSDELAEQRARYEIYLNARLHDTVNISTVPIYWLDVNDIIEFNPPNASADEHNMWIIKNINTSMGVDNTDLQTITAIRYYPLYADISLENLATQ